MEQPLQPKNNGKKLVLSPTMRLQLRRNRHKRSPNYKGSLDWEAIHQRLSKVNQTTEIYSDPAKILRERAAELARPVYSGISSTSTNTTVVLQQVSCRIAFDVEFVREIIPLESVTYVPGVPEFIVGVVNARGKILTLINLELFLHPQATRSLANQEDQKQTIVMLETGSFEFGVLCNGFPIIGQHSLRSFRELTDVTLDYRSQHLQGIDPEGILLINLPSLVADPAFLVEQD
jgi:purine-binding chemotaxis protein CheW